MITILFILITVLLTIILLISGNRLYYDIYATPKNKKYKYTITFRMVSKEEYKFRFFSNDSKKNKEDILKSYFSVKNNELAIKKDSRQYYSFNDVVNIGVMCEEIK